MSELTWFREHVNVKRVNLGKTICFFQKEPKYVRMFTENVHKAVFYDDVNNY